MPAATTGKRSASPKCLRRSAPSKAGLIDDDKLAGVRDRTPVPAAARCSGMYTANTMNCLCEAIGIALPGNGTIPAVYSRRIHAGQARRYGDHGAGGEEHHRRGDIINEKSIRNALACDMALGCSSNSVLHLLAIANEARRSRSTSILSTR